MTRLNNQQKQLLFDYCIGLTSEKETADAEALISSDRQAAEIHSKLKTAFIPLKSLEPDTCPDDLAEQTIQHLNSLARSSQLRLQQLLAAEQGRGEVSVKSWFWRSVGELIATAAVLVFVAGIVIAPLNLARQKSWQQRCQMQLHRIWQGINNYCSEYNGKMPAVATAAGSPWWKVGYQGGENHSNTRHIWLLAKNGYVDPDDFVCPGKRQGRAIKFDSSRAKDYNDFPSRRYITYSLRIKCNKSPKKHVAGRKVLMSDLNPLFEELPGSYSDSLKLQLNQTLLALNSISHNRCGQNVLFCDGSVEFLKKRDVGILQDDIFTLQNTEIYQGIEVPGCETDAFLAP